MICFHWPCVTTYHSTTAVSSRIVSIIIFVFDVDRGEGSQVPSELSMGPFSVTRSNPTHQLTDPTRPDPLQVENLDPTQYN